MHQGFNDQGLQAFFAGISRRHRSPPRRLHHRTPPAIHLHIHLPLGIRRFLRNDVTDRKLIEKWARNLDFDRVLPILAEYEGCIVASATLHYQTFGWGRHVAEVRITIAPEFQGRRLGAALLDEISYLAAQSKVKKLLARIVTTREGVIRAFARAGFSQLTILENYVKDLQNQQYANIALMVKELPAGAHWPACEGERLRICVAS
jgi:L-amino acid N-acyltransferase YncA